MTGNSKQTLQGMISLILAGLAYSLFGVFARYISKDFGLFYQAVSRYIVCVIIFAVLAYYFRAIKKIEAKDRKWFIIRAIVSAGVNIPFFLSVINLPLGTALFLFYASSVIVSYLFGFIILAEKLNRIKIVSLLLAFAGIFLIYQDSLQLTGSVYTLTAILSGGFFGIYSTSSKMVNLKYSAVQINLIEYLLVIAITIPLMIISKETVYLNILSFSWMMNIFYSLALAVATFFTVYGFKHIEAQVGSLVLLSELIFVVINGFIFFHEIPTMTTAIGGFFILTALVLPNLNLGRSRI
jgi:drug/metabolite transporter (DMT)-like permease